MYLCDFIFQVWEYIFEDFSIFGFYQFSIVVLVTYLHKSERWIFFLEFAFFFWVVSWYKKDNQFKLKIPIL